MKKESKTTILDKIFGGLKLTWPRLIIASVVIGVFVGILMTIPPLVDTSFTRIGVIFYWWVLFGTIIIANSKSNLDSALKCFVFFLISQPLIYLTQILVGSADWSLMGYYRNWIGWTIATLPMGFVGYWIKRKDIWAMLIITAATLIVVLEGLGEFNIAIEQFPRYLLSGIICFVIAIVMVLGILKDWKLRGISFGILAVFAIAISIFDHFSTPQVFAGLSHSLSEYGVTTEKEWHIESDFGDRARLEIYDEYGEDGNPNGNTFYVLMLTYNGEDMGEHDFKLTSEGEELSCKISLAEKNYSINCGE